MNDYILDHNDLKLTAPSRDAGQTILIMAGARKQKECPGRC